MSLRIRRGSDAERLGVRFDQGEIVWVNSTNTSRPAYKLYVGDGVTQGGIDILQTSAGNKLVYNTNTGRLDVAGLTTDDIAAGTNNQFFTKELAWDAVGELFAAGTMTGIEFVYNDLSNKMDVTVTATGGPGGDGIEAIVEDLTPSLGGNLNLNNKNITGTGNINITGNSTVSGTVSATGGLGANLALNGFNLTGSGDINIAGAISITSTFISAGLGADLSLNSFNVEGQGDIDITGDIKTTGDINIIGTITTNGGTITGTLLGSFEGEVISPDFTVLVNSATKTLKTSQLTISGDNISGVADSNVTFGSNSTRNNLVVYQPVNGSGLTINAQISGAPGITQLGSNIRLASVSGTLAAPVSLSVGDLCGQVQYSGYVNGGPEGSPIMIDLAGIRAVVETTGDLSTTIGAGKLQFFVANQNDPFNSKFAEFDVRGVFSAPVVQTGYYTTTERDALTPAFGMMIYNTTDNKFQGYQNTSGTTPQWVDLS